MLFCEKNCLEIEQYFISCEWGMAFFYITGFCTVVGFFCFVLFYLVNLTKTYYAYNSVQHK